MDSTTDSQPVDRDWQAVCRGEAAAAFVGLSARRAGQPLTLLPGSFNPLHAGHRQMVRLARRWTARIVDFELSIVNVDKRELTEDQVERRLPQFADDEGVWVTRAATFRQKSRLFAGAVFVVGADTIQRLGDARYYHDAADCEASIREIAENGCRFLVCGRLLAGRFRTIRDLTLSDSLREICSQVPESEFRHDVSSTQLRGDP